MGHNDPILESVVRARLFHFIGYQSLPEKQANELRLKYSSFILHQIHSPCFKMRICICLCVYICIRTCAYALCMWGYVLIYTHDTYAHTHIFKKNNSHIGVCVKIYCTNASPHLLERHN